MILISFDKAFDTSYATGNTPFFSPVEELSITDLFHELLHHVISPKKYVDYGSQLEGAVHEHVIRNYQSMVGSAEQMFTTLEMLGFDGSKYHGQDRVPPDEAKAFLTALQEDVSKAETPELKPILERFVKRIENLIRRAGSQGPMASDISREKDALEEKANKAASELIPAGTEERVREWYRWLELAFRQTRP